MADLVKRDALRSYLPGSPLGATDHGYDALKKMSDSISSPVVSSTTKSMSMREHRPARDDSETNRRLAVVLPGCADVTPRTDRLIDAVGTACHVANARATAACRSDDVTPAHWNRNEIAHRSWRPFERHLLTANGDAELQVGLGRLQLRRQVRRQHAHDRPRFIAALPTRTRTSRSKSVSASARRVASPRTIGTVRCRAEVGRRRHQPACCQQFGPYDRRPG